MIRGEVDSTGRPILVRAVRPTLWNMLRNLLAMALARLAWWIAP